VSNQSIPVRFGKVKVRASVVGEVLTHPVDDFPQNNISEEVILVMTTVI
jgi:hypothetical protein